MHRRQGGKLTFRFSADLISLLNDATRQVRQQMPSSLSAW